MAFNSAGEGPESERYLERTFRKAPQKPPASVNVWAYNPTTVRVVWRYVQPTDEEEPLLGYKVKRQSHLFKIRFINKQKLLQINQFSWWVMELANSLSNAPFLQS